MTPEELRKINQTAWERSGGDAALWFHHLALIEGCLNIHNRDEQALQAFAAFMKLPQFRDCEASVIEGWRKFTENVTGVPPELQRDDYAKNCAIVIDALRRQPAKAAEVLKERPETFGEAARQGNVEFLKHVGRLLTKRRASNHLRDFDYAQAILSHWLTSYLWLMPERTAADFLAERFLKRISSEQDSDRELRHFRKVKASYGLKSHRPTLVVEIKPDGSIVFTAEGIQLLRSSVVPRK